MCAFYRSEIDLCNLKIREFVSFKRYFSSVNSEWISEFSFRKWLRSQDTCRCIWRPATLTIFSISPISSKKCYTCRRYNLDISTHRYNLDISRHRYDLDISRHIHQLQLLRPSFCKFSGLPKSAYWYCSCHLLHLSQWVILTLLHYFTEALKKRYQPVRKLLQDFRNKFPWFSHIYFGKVSLNFFDFSLI